MKLNFDELKDLVILALIKLKDSNAYLVEFLNRDIHYGKIISYNGSYGLDIFFDSRSVCHFFYWQELDLWKKQICWKYNLDLDKISLEIYTDYSGRYDCNEINYLLISGGKEIDIGEPGGYHSDMKQFAFQLIRVLERIERDIDPALEKNSI